MIHGDKEGLKKTILEVIDGTVWRFSYKYNIANQLISYFDPITSQPYTLNYDKQGNLTSKEDYLGTTTFKWNSKNRLTETNLPSGEIFTYSYSSSGTRLTKGSSNGTFTKYSYDGIKLQSEVTKVTEVTEGTEVTKVTTTSFSYTPSGEPYSIHLSTLTSPLSTSYYYHLNAHGDVISMTDQQGREVASYSYGPWGNVEKAKGTFAGTNPIRYAGYYYDTESELYYLINRYYDSSLGRFISRDAFNQPDSDSLGKNKYIYCLNDPLSKIDPTGADAWPTHHHKFPWGNEVFSNYSQYARKWLERNEKLHKKDPNKGNYYCSGLAVQILIDYATYGKRRLKLYNKELKSKGEKDIYDSDQYKKKSAYVADVRDNAIQAIDIAKHNTKGIGFGRARVGDLLLYDNSLATGIDPETGIENKYIWHTRVIFANLIKKKSLTYFQGNDPPNFERGYDTWQNLKYDGPNRPLYGKTLSPRRWLAFTPFKGQL